MLKAVRLPRFLLLLAGVLFIAALFTNTISALLSPITPTALAADSQVAGSAGACTGSSHSPSFGGTVTVTPAETLCSDVTAFGSTVDIRGQVRGNMLAFGSTIIIDGGVIGNITLFGGSVAFHTGFTVHGNVNLYGSSVYRERGFHIDGTYNDHSQVGFLFGITTFSFPAWFLFLMLPLGLLSIWLLPEHVMFVSATVKNKMRRSLLIGLLSALLAPVVVIILFALIISIPFALILLLALLVAWTLGIIAISWMIGEQIIHALTSRPHARYLPVVVGVIALAMVTSLPYIGWLVGLATGFVGLGAVLLSRFGTRLYSQPKQPITI
jgi:hypothetical protein